MNNVYLICGVISSVLSLLAFFYMLHLINKPSGVDDDPSHSIVSCIILGFKVFVISFCLLLIIGHLFT